MLHWIPGQKGFTHDVHYNHIANIISKKKKKFV
jgi:hypothetical protein